MTSRLHRQVCAGVSLARGAAVASVCIAAALLTEGCLSVALPFSVRPAFVFTAAGDYGTSPDAIATLKAIGQAGADLHLTLGDLSYDGAQSEEKWCTLVKSSLGEELPVLLLAGNHEDDTGGDGHITLFNKCLPDRIGVTGLYGVEYFFDYRNVARFIQISPGLTIDGEHYYYGDRNRHYRWLEDAIDGARAKGIPWVFVGMHKNCISIGAYYCQVYQQLMDLLVRKQVDLVLSGHDHTYQRSKQLSSGLTCSAVTVDSFDPQCVFDDGADSVYEKGRGTVFVVAGTGGEPLYEVNPADPEAAYFAAWMGANHQPRKGFVRFTVTATALTAEFVGTTFTSSFTDIFAVRIFRP